MNDKSTYNRQNAIYHGTTWIISNTTHPNYNYHKYITFPYNANHQVNDIDILSQCKLYISVYNRPIASSSSLVPIVSLYKSNAIYQTNDILLGQTVVNCNSLQYGGFNEISGWYHILNQANQSNGQIYINITSKEYYDSQINIMKSIEHDEINHKIQQKHPSFYTDINKKYI